MRFPRATVTIPLLSLLRSLAGHRMRGSQNSPGGKEQALVLLI